MSFSLPIGGEEGGWRLVGDELQRRYSVFPPLEGAQDAAGVAGIEAEAGAERPDLGPFRSDLPEDTGLA